MPVFSSSSRLIFLVIGCIAINATIYNLTMSYCILAGIKPDASVGQAFNHIGDVLMGALIGMLAKTTITREDPTPKPTKVEVVNTVAQPVPTEEANANP